MEQAEMIFTSLLHSHCKRCGKKLSDPKSMKRGYGPICAKKIQWEQKKQATINEFYHKGEKEVNNHPSLSEYWNEVLENTYRTKCTCGSDLFTNGIMDHYEHSGGCFVNGYKNKQWIFITCLKCNYSWSISKLTRGKILILV